VKRCAQFIGEGQCPEPAQYRYTWPGRDEAVICAVCVGKLLQVAAAMGLSLQIIDLAKEVATP